MIYVQIFGGIFFILGPILVAKTDWFVENVGRIEWAEQHLQGGTYFFFKLLGIGFVILGLLMIFNLFGPLILWMLGPILPKK
ncbi:MAG: hypothetical protein NTZ49_05450 [Candidatus Parcubacteria bacterium]|nr:hypothetical protein [Candidatus Parcubacteria bacterium]